MITVNPAFLSEVNRNFVARFKRGLGRIAPVYPELAQVEISTSAMSVYGFLNAIGTLREWVGNRVVDDYKSYDFAIKNRHFEKTIRVRRDSFEDDQFGFYGTQAEDLGDAAARHPDILVAALIEAGFTALGADGVAFFATTHPGPNGTTLSNKGTSALTPANYAAARAQMAALKDDGGEVLDMNMDLLVVPPALEETARNILFADPVFVAGVPQNNVWKNSARLLVMKRLTDTNNWYLFDTSKVLKPFIMQFRKRPEIVAQTSLTDESVWRRGEFEWGVDYRGEAAYALWQLAFGASV